MARNLSVARIVIAGLMMALAFGLVSLPTSAQQFLTINVPGSTDTVITGMDPNTSRSFVGYSIDSNNSQQGFLFAGGKFDAVHFPGRA